MIAAEAGPIGVVSLLDTGLSTAPHVPMTANSGDSGTSALKPWDSVAIADSAAAPKRPKLDIVLSESESSSASSDSDAETAQPSLITDAGFCFLCNMASGIGHWAAILDSAGSRTLAWELDGVTRFLRPGCGAQTDLDRASYKVANELPSGYEPCKRLGCRAPGRVGANGGSDLPTTPPQ